MAIGERGDAGSDRLLGPELTNKVAVILRACGRGLLIYAERYVDAHAGLDRVLPLCST